jgi:hypothetical protein
MRNSTAFSSTKSIRDIRAFVSAAESLKTSTVRLVLGIRAEENRRFGTPDGGKVI